MLIFFRRCKARKFDFVDGGKAFEDFTCQRLRPLSVPVGLPPVRIILTDNMEDVSPLEADPELVTGNVEVVIRRVGEVSPIVKLKCDNIIIKKTHAANTLS